MTQKFSVIIDQEVENDRWWCWLSPLDAMDNPTDEYRTQCYAKRKTAVDRMITMCRANSELGGVAVKAVRETDKEDR